MEFLLLIMMTLLPGMKIKEQLIMFPSNRIAQSGEDYSSLSGVLTFEPGKKTATIIIPISNDKLPENKEDFLLTLSNPVNATLTNSTATITIDSNDEIGFIATDIVTDADNAQMFILQI